MFCKSRGLKPSLSNGGFRALDSTVCKTVYSTTFVVISVRQNEVGAFKDDNDRDIGFLWRNLPRNEDEGGACDW